MEAYSPYERYLSQIQTKPVNDTFASLINLGFDKLFNMPFNDFKELLLKTSYDKNRIEKIPK